MRVRFAHCLGQDSQIFNDLRNTCGIGVRATAVRPVIRRVSARLTLRAPLWLLWEACNFRWERGMRGHDINMPRA